MYHYIYRMNHLLLVLLVLNVNIYNLMLDTMVYLVLLLETDSVEREQRVAAGWTWHWFTFFFPRLETMSARCQTCPRGTLLMFSLVPTHKVTTEVWLTDGSTLFCCITGYVLSWTLRCQMSAIYSSLELTPPRMSWRNISLTLNVLKYKYNSKCNATWNVTWKRKTLYLFNRNLALSHTVSVMSNIVLAVVTGHVAFYLKHYFEHVLSQLWYKLLFTVGSVITTCCCSNLMSSYLFIAIQLLFMLKYIQIFSFEIQLFECVLKLWTCWRKCWFWTLTRE